MNDADRPAATHGAAPRPVPSSAVGHAEAVAAGQDALDWRRLERAQLAAAPELIEAWEAVNAELDAPPPGRRSAWVGAGAFALALVPFVVPGMLIAAIRLDQSLTGPLAATIALSLAQVAGRLVQLRRARRGAPVESATGLLLGAVAVPFSALGATFAALIALQRPEPLAWPAAFSAAAMTVVLVAWLVLERRRARTAAPHGGSEGAADRLRRLVEALPPELRSRLDRDREDALDRLVASGAIDEDTRRDAAAVPPGGLGRWAWAHERSRARRGPA
ncbi:hypothetical protein ACFPER_01285 [Agromyces aurantiacus]|uniref:Uncharacterized protein n=1 Tax=Agromyces aurantiacus TaxID=165814 RepID=A0ABV9R513_9MICO|nr:hypothetical protein [Agromyces aurantiacus]MBM7505719.1 hypothetical protein [Agromyces aurantiacus]